jgi:hypothetical protein
MCHQSNSITYILQMQVIIVGMTKYWHDHMGYEFLPTALRAVGLGITLSTFYSFYRDKPRNGHLDILTTRRCSMLLDATMLLYTT